MVVLCDTLGLANGIFTRYWYMGHVDDAYFYRLLENKNIAHEITSMGVVLQGPTTLVDCPSLVNLPEYLTVHGDINLSKCTSLTSLSGNLKVRGNLFLAWCTGITDISGLLEVDANAHFLGCTSIVKLGNNIKVGQTLNLKGCTSLRQLPFGLEVKGNLWLDGCTLYPFPQDLKVGGSIYGDYKIISNTERFIFDEE